MGDQIRTQNNQFSLKGRILPAATNDFPTSYFIGEYRKLAEFVYSRNAQILLIWPVLCTEDSISDLITFQKICAKRGIVIHGNPEKFMFRPDCFSDTNYHLKDICAAERAERFAESLKQIPELKFKKKQKHR